jgi:hypothetical protein
MRRCNPPPVKTHIMKLIQTKNTSRPKFLINKELTGILTIIAVFLLFPYLVRQVDYSAAAIDPGILSAVILSIASVLIFQAVTWWIIRVIWQVFHIYSTHHFENNFKSLEPWQKVIIYLGFYLLLLYSFVTVLSAFL